MFVVLIEFVKRLRPQAARLWQITNTLLLFSFNDKIPPACGRYGEAQRPRLGPNALFGDSKILTGTNPAIRKVKRCVDTRLFHFAELNL